MMQRQYLFPTILGVSLFLLYASLQASSVFGGDSGDLLSAIAVIGVPHPSGYPLYTLMGIVLSYLPIESSLAWKVGLGSALLSSLSVVFVYLIVIRLLGNKLYALVTSLTVAFFFPFWLYAQITEVMAMQHFFISVILYLSIRYNQEGNRKTLLLTAFFCGLALTNNQTVLLLFPSVFLLVAPRLWKFKGRIKLFMSSLMIFLIGLLPYLYLPIAASFSPPVNWNNPVTLESFLNIVLRRDYGWLPTVVVDNSIRLLILKQYLLYLFSELTIIGVLFIGVGIITMVKRGKNRVFAFAFLLGGLLFGPFFYYYGANPTFGLMSDGAREKFIASSAIFAILLMPYGMNGISLFISRLLKKIGADAARLKIYSRVMMLFFFLLPLMLFFDNLRVLDLRHSVRITEVFARELLKSLPKNTVLIAQHDNIIFPVWYTEYSQGFRDDVYATLPHELKNLARRGMIKLTPNPIVSVLPSDADPDNDVHAIALQLPTAVVISESDYHGFVKADTIVLIPHGFVLKYANESERKLTKEQFLKRQDALLAGLSDPRELLSAEKKERLWLLRNIPLFYSHAYANTGYFLMYAYKDYSLARKYFMKAISIDDQDHWALEGLGITYYQQKNYKKARASFEKAVATEPLNHNAYYLLYGTTLALKDKKSSQSLENFFKQYDEIYTEFNFGKTRVRVPQ